LNDILDFSKVEAGKIELVDSPVNPQILIQETIDLFSELAHKKNLEIQHVWLGPENQYYLADPLRLRQMLSNLTSNAIKFTDEGYIQITAKELYREGDRAFLEFAVKDTGMGISEADQSLLFKSFSQIISNQRAIQSGSGLGLSIVASLVDVMGGVYGVESSLGKGASFWFRIPVKCLENYAQPEIKHEDEFFVDDTSIKYANFIGRILIAEDNLTNRQVLKAMVSNLLPKVIIDEVENGSEALEAVKMNSHYDLIFMDIQMPIMDGMVASQKIREYQRLNNLLRVPIVAVTAYAYADDRAKYLSLSMDFLAKPIGLHKLKICIDNWLFKQETDKEIASESPIEISQDQIFNKQAMLDRLGGDQRLAVSIIESATQEMPKYIDLLYTAIQEDDWIQVRSIMHTLKGLIMQIGGDVLAKDIMHFESILRSGAYIDIDHVRSIEKEYALLKEEIIKDGMVSIASIYPQK
jgi:CheY-like chemotaxis protein